jgi:glutaminyl-tRNA synthetase
MGSNDDKKGTAYIDSQSSEDMASQKGKFTQPGVDGPVVIVP